MSNPIQDKGKALLALLSDKKTADTYKNFFVLTWEILKETALFLWLMILFIIVSVGWVVDRSSNLGDVYANWQQEAAQKQEGNVATEMGTKVWEASKNSAVSALASARKQLNIEAPPPKAPKAKATGAAQPTAQAASATPSTPPKSAPSAPTAVAAPPAASEPAAKPLGAYTQDAATNQSADSSEA